MAMFLTSLTLAILVLTLSTGDSSTTPGYRTKSSNSIFTRRDRSDDIASAWNRAAPGSSTPLLRRSNLNDVIEREDPEDTDTSQTQECILRTYDADKEADVIRAWHDLIKTSIDEDTAMRQLLIEACDDDDKDIEVMCLTYLRAKLVDKRVPGLTRAECIAVTMYTAEEGGFYAEYNNASAYGVWTPYRVYTSLLLSAVKKLAAIEPVPHDAALYRGIRLKCRPSGARKIFFKTFTSTSLDEDIAAYFGRETSLVFQPKATIYGARIRNLSLIDVEDEVLIPPFELFEFLDAEGQTYRFSAAKDQELLGYNSAGGWSRLEMTTASAISFLVFLTPRFLT